MRKKLFSQEGLKLLACTTMLIDHIGALMLHNIWFRIIGRLAFPIYCFLLVEGIHHSKNLKKYQNRMIFSAVLAEIPFDLAISGRLNFENCSVMVTLLLGFWAVRAMGKTRGLWKWVVPVPFFLAAELMRTDYGGMGILMIVLFELTRGRHEWLKAAGMVTLNWQGSLVFGVPVQLYAVLALIPIWLYSGEKLTHNRVVQWAFYLFYPAHLLVLYFLR